MKKKYTKKYIKEAIEYWTKRLAEAESAEYMPAKGEIVDYSKLLGLGPDEIVGRILGGMIVCNKKTGECRSFTDAECDKIRAFHERYFRA